MNKYHNKTITCNVDDARLIKRIKRAGCFKKTNEVIKVLVETFMDTLSLETQTNIRGIGYVSKCKEIICK